MMMMMMDKNECYVHHSHTQKTGKQKWMQFKYTHTERLSDCLIDDLCVCASATKLPQCLLYIWMNGFSVCMWEIQI